MTDTPLLTVRNLKVAFSNDVVLRNIAFEVGRGDFLGIIGPNGSGKTVLIKTILGIFPYSGEIILAPDIRIGYVPQRVDLDRYLSLTLIDFLGLKIKIRKLPQHALDQIITLLKIDRNVLQTPLRLLSGGQLQKGMIAFALLDKPDIVFFDEPTANLDLPREEQIYEILHELQDEWKIAVVFISHELSLVSRYANKILCINRDLICFGETGKILTSETLGKLYGTSTHLHQL